MLAPYYFNRISIEFQSNFLSFSHCDFLSLHLSHAPRPTPLELGHDRLQSPKNEELLFFVGDFEIERALRADNGDGRSRAGRTAAQLRPLALLKLPYIA